VSALRILAYSLRIEALGCFHYSPSVISLNRLGGRWYFIILIVFVLTVAGAGLFLRESNLLADPEGRIRCAPGPWGDLRYVPMWIELPTESANRIVSTIPATRWFVKGTSKENALAEIAKAGLTADELQWLRAKAEWKEGEGGYWIVPGEEFPLQLNSESREQFYRFLGNFPENGFHQTPFLFRPEWLEERVKRSKLPKSVTERFKNALYTRGRLRVFSDVSALLATIPDEGEKVKFVKMLSAKPTMLLKLRVDAHSSIEQLAEYWGQRPRKKDVYSLLESMAAVSGGCKIDVAHLMPGFARAKIYTYPSPRTNQSKPALNCHWTSFNFFHDPPDDAFLDNRYMQEVLDRDYDPVQGEKHLGDIVLLLDRDNKIIHSAVHVADDIVFTKLGGAETQPWIYMRIDDMMPYYSVDGVQISKVVVCRRRS
jgi:hypothetical protein